MDDVQRYLAAHMDLDHLQRQSGNSRYFDHCEAALVAAVVAYCRSFKRSESKGNATSKLQGTDLICIESNTEFEELHSLLLERRDTAIAHADWVQHNTELLSVEENSVFRRVSVPNLVQGIDVQKFMQLSEAIRQEVVAKSHAIDVNGGSRGVA
ncbi:hypothetical protein [Pelomonas sp. SE-A7]|uniref:hypothetical protein n=1 Tax=Pelomonas sp. SE-A7 TaxID=3054953 RepID=UPI00259CFABF|nr:hypothetical protein [Pelomonas sp. SE-A7]MDM4767195.1 hypothetical protein [Pelomonas sp. SE-A7]